MSGAHPISEPKLSEVYKTLKFLANLSRSTIAKPNTTDSPKECQNCGGDLKLIKRDTVIAKTREEILKNLEKTEARLRSAGQPLPLWIQAYKEGNNMKAAKLLHIHYTAMAKRPSSSSFDSVLSVKRARLTSEHEVTTTTTMTNGNEIKAQADSTTVNILQKKRINSGSRGL